MGRKKLILDITNRVSSEDSDSGNSSDADSDEELQKAFASGQLKPGLNALVPFRRTEEHVNDKNGLKEKLDQMKLNLDWIERLDMVNTPAEVTPEVRQMFGDIDLKVNKKGEISTEDQSIDKTDNDFKREMLFYRRAQSAVLEAIPRLRKMKIVTKRPEDYFAEMAKTDDHMKKVRENIVRRQTAMELSEKAKKMRELKKYGKKIQQEVLVKRQKDKREMLDKLKKYKSGKEDNLGFLDNDRGSGQQKSGDNSAKRKPNKVNQKQKYKNSRFGYGGQKKRSKYNTSSSSADMSKFKASRHSKPSKGKQRPGKGRRQQMKNKKK